MKENKYEMRGKLCKLFMKKQMFTHIGAKIMLLFENIDLNSKEDLAEQMIPLIEQSETEEEALELCQELVEVTAFGAGELPTVMVSGSA